MKTLLFFLLMLASSCFADATLILIDENVESEIKTFATLEHAEPETMVVHPMQWCPSHGPCYSCTVGTKLIFSFYSKGDLPYCVDDVDNKIIPALAVD